MWQPALLDALWQQLVRAVFVMLRYETEYTPCTGITAVHKQERRTFPGAYTIAPWCPHLKRADGEDPLLTGKVKRTPWSFVVHGVECRVLVTDDGYSPIVFFQADGYFLGVETPYDTPVQRDGSDAADTLQRDALFFGLAVDVWLRGLGTPRPFVWAADWETVPALARVHERHVTALTLHNTFDAGLHDVAAEFGDAFLAFRARRPASGLPQTALEVGLHLADVVTTVNRGFAHGMKTELAQRVVMAPHLTSLLDRVVGIDNASFARLSQDAERLQRTLVDDPASGLRQLLDLKAAARSRLPADLAQQAEGKVVVVSMGRRVAQKQHDVLVESVRALVEHDATLPILVVFATVHGDEGSPARLRRMQDLALRYPAHVVCLDGRLPFYADLMAVADFNCMPSLWEPHGAAFEGTVIPIARAVDGLAEQICAWQPKGRAAALNRVWHHEADASTGFLFRETDESSDDIAALVRVSPSPDNATFRAMCGALAETLLDAVVLRLTEPERYAALVAAALERQRGESWLVNLGGMLALIEQARARRIAA